MLSVYTRNQNSNKTKISLIEYVDMTKVKTLY
jgi:hypothetical protein